MLHHSKAEQKKFTWNFSINEISAFVKEKGIVMEHWTWSHLQFAFFFVGVSLIHCIEWILLLPFSRREMTKRNKMKLLMRFLERPRMECARLNFLQNISRNQYFFYFSDLGELRVAISGEYSIFAFMRSRDFTGDINAFCARKSPVPE